MTNRAFLGLLKLFLSNKGVLPGDDISLVKDDKKFTADRDLLGFFNNYYINIVENTSGKIPSNIANVYSVNDNREIV